MVASVDVVAVVGLAMASIIHLNETEASGAEETDRPTQ